MQHLRDLRRFLQQPLVNVLGMLGAAAAAKSGNGGLAAEGILAFVLVYMSAVVSPGLASKLALWVADSARSMTVSRHSGCLPVKVTIELIGQQQ